MATHGREERLDALQSFIAERKRKVEAQRALRAGLRARELPKALRSKLVAGGAQSQHQHHTGALRRRVVWTNRDVALFVACHFVHGDPEASPSHSFLPSCGAKSRKWRPYFQELLGQGQGQGNFERRDIRRMFRRLKEDGVLDDLSRLQHLRQADKDRIIPKWLTDDVAVSSASVSVNGGVGTWERKG